MKIDRLMDHIIHVSEQEPDREEGRKDRKEDKNLMAYYRQGRKVA
jgi:hypothetical protein